MSDNEELATLTNKIVGELDSSVVRKRARSKASHEGFRNAVMEILCLVIRSSFNAHWPPISIGLRRGEYSSKYRYRPMLASYRLLRDAYLAMLRAGLLIELGKGWFDVGTMSGRKTSFLPTDKLKGAITTLSQKSRRSAMTRDFGETIIMKVKSGRRSVQKDYVDTDLTHQMRINLNRINSCFAKHWFSLCLSDEEFKNLARAIYNDPSRGNLDLSQTRLRRIFAQGSFELGGRFYGGWWQHVPKNYRQFITIDGEETCEYDFDQMNPHIAYLYLGKELGSEDAYSRVFGEEHRDVAKVAFNAMLNARSQLSQKPRNLDLEDRPFSWPKLRNKVLEAHRPIEELFFQGLGLHFQFVDSQIAEQVMLSFLPDDAPCLPIHDSFIMHHSYGEGAGGLEETMRQVFRSIMGTDIGVRREFVQLVQHDRSLNPEITAA